MPRQIHPEDVVLYWRVSVLHIDNVRHQIMTTRFACTTEQVARSIAHRASTNDGCVTVMRPVFNGDITGNAFEAYCGGVKL